MMNDRTISITAAFAVFLYLVGFTLLVLGYFGEWRLMPFGLWVSSLAALLTVRRMICQMIHREQGAFDLGRESIRSVR